MLKEKLDMATILDGAKTNEEIAQKLEEYGVLCPPCKIGDKVYCVVAKSGLNGGLLHTAHIIERKADFLFYNGKRWGMRSNELNYGDGRDNGVLYLWFGGQVFVNLYEAENRVKELLRAGKNQIDD